MVFINHEKKAIFIHNPKCGGAYVRDILLSYYGFQPFATQKHDQLADFMDSTDQIDPVVNDKHTIRRQGKVRYFLSHQDAAGRQDAFRDYFKFAFVRNPYARLVSAYKYCKIVMLNSCKKNPNIRGLAENPQLYVDLKTFVLQRDCVNNIAFFHAFITQYDQLVDDKEQTLLDYIGRTENLDEEFLCILEKIGIDEIKHGDLLFFGKKINDTTDEEEDITLLYDEETLAFTNAFFQKDFDTFGYKQYGSLADFQGNYLADSRQVKYDSKRKREEMNRFRNNQQITLLKKYADVVDTFMEMVVNGKTVCSQTITIMQDNVDYMNETRLHLSV